MQTEFEATIIEDLPKLAGQPSAMTSSSQKLL
jgi:hypothetical protein